MNWKRIAWMAPITNDGGMPSYLLNILIGAIAVPEKFLMDNYPSEQQ
jgi:hypothetical protein